MFNVRGIGSKDGQVFGDDITGHLLPADLVRFVRQTELDDDDSEGVLKLVPAAPASARSGRPPISVRWSG